MNKVGMIRCSVCYNCSIAEKDQRKPQACVKDGQCGPAPRQPLENQCLSAFAYISAKKHNGMINASGIHFVEEGVNHDSFLLVKIILCSSDI